MLTQRWSLNTDLCSLLARTWTFLHTLCQPSHPIELALRCQWKCTLQGISTVIMEIYLSGPSSHNKKSKRRADDKNRTMRLSWTLYLSKLAYLHSICSHFSMICSSFHVPNHSIYWYLLNCVVLCYSVVRCAVLWYDLVWCGVLLWYDVFCYTHHIVHRRDRVQNEGCWINQCTDGQVRFSTHSIDGTHIR